jgi:hypothetical protein
MGMFDSIMLMVKCPFCGQLSKMECQTKELECTLARFKKGDNTGHPEIAELYCCCECEAGCKRQIGEIHPGRPWFRGRFMNIIVYTPMGLITGKYRIETNEELKMNIGGLPINDLLSYNAETLKRMIGIAIPIPTYLKGIENQDTSKNKNE